MKTLFTLGSLFVAMVFASCSFASETTPKAATEKTEELSIVVVEMLARHSSEYDAFNRIARIFTEEFERQNWPLKIDVERFAANTPDHDIELRISYQGIQRVAFDDLTFRAWATLTVHGNKHDFGIITYAYYPRVGEPMDDATDKAVRGGAALVIERISKVLYPQAAAKKP